MNLGGPSEATKVFRQAALDRLSSPEQLDRLIAITGSRDWWAGLALCLLLGVAIAWGVLGSVPTKVKGSGILIATGGRVFDAISLGDGIVAEILPKPGDTVTQGQVLARIDQPNLIQSLESARAVLDERKKQYDGRKQQIDAYTVSRQQNNDARRRSLEQKITNGETRAKAVEVQVQSEEKMFQQHLITWQVLHESRQDLAASRQTVLDSRSQLVQIDAEEINARNGDERDLTTAQERIADAQRQVADQELQLKQRESVISPAAGRVTEIKAVPGGRVGGGTPVVSIESGVTGLQAVIYLPPDQGKQVKPGMDVRISPSTVKREEYGTLVGTVVDVSDFPSTGQAMQATLQNDRLVSQFSPRGAPFAARIDLTRDPTTVTGYRWSGGVGPATTISSGTIADAEVTVRELPPISFVIPALRKATGLDD
jgi:HlyD family secretion protein